MKYQSGDEWKQKNENIELTTKNAMYGPFQRRHSFNTGAQADSKTQIVRCEYAHKTDIDNDVDQKTDQSSKREIELVTSTNTGTYVDVCLFVVSVSECACGGGDGY